jgi:hypothetical protein
MKTEGERNEAERVSNLRDEGEAQQWVDCLAERVGRVVAWVRKVVVRRGGGSP